MDQFFVRLTIWTLGGCDRLDNQNKLSASHLSIYCERFFVYYYTELLTFEVFELM